MEQKVALLLDQFLLLSDLALLLLGLGAGLVAFPLKLVLQQAIPCLEVVVIAAGRQELLLFVDEGDTPRTVRAHHALLALAVGGCRPTAHRLT